MKIKANGIMQYYEITGSGDWLVLIHSAMHTHNIWCNQVPAFSTKYKVLTYDVRGCGQTEAAGNYRNDVYVEDLYGLLKALGIKKAHFMGWGSSGTVAVNFINNHPEMAKSLILCSSGGIPITEGGTRWYQGECKVRLEAVEKGGILGLCKTFYPPSGYFFSPGFPEKHREVIKKFESLMLQRTPENLLDVLGYRSIKPSDEPVDLKKYEKMYGKIPCPTLIISGQYDKASGPEPSKIIQKWIHGAELKILPTGHLTFFEQPEEVNKTVLAFLAKVGKKQKRS